MYNRRILISEDEKSRILNLHENRKVKEWGFIFEQATTPGTTTPGTTTPDATSGGGTCASAPGLKKLEDEIAFRAFAKKNYGEEVVQFGKINIPGFVDKPSVFCNPKFKALGIVYNHKPASGGGKSIGELYLAGGGASGGATSSAAGTTFYIDGKPTALSTDQEIGDMVKSKKITQDTFVFKSPEIPKPTKISELPEDSPIKKAVMAIIATVPPELPGETKTFKISPDGKQPAKDYTAEQLTAAIKDGSLTQNAFVVVTDQATGKSTYQSIMQNPDASKIVNLASGPGQVADQFKTTGVPELDAWLKGPIGSVWDKMEEGKLKEKSLDTYKRQDPQLKAIMDKMGEGKVRDALGTKRNNMLARGFANIKKAGVEALGGTVTKTR